MPTAGPNPTVSRLELAARLRELRLQAGRSIEEAAAELMCSVAKISRMETGGRGVQPRDIRDLCRFYAVSSDVREELTRLGAEARVPNPWQRDFRNLDDPVATAFGLEAAATSTRMFEISIVPGLLQTPDFTRALLADIRPPGELTSEWIEETVAVRERRQKRVESGELELHAIVDEAALSRPIGGPAVMRAQVDRLIDEAARPNVRLQVIPFERGPHPGMDGSFQHLSFERHRIDEVVYVEGLLGYDLLDKSDVVARYRMVFDDLSTRIALDADATTRWLKAAAHGRLSSGGGGRRRSGAQ